MKMGVRTELEIARSVDKGDLDPVQIVSLPGQTQLMEALAQLGFRFKSADVEKGRLRGATLPFFQEIEFSPGPEYRGKFNELEVTFLGGPQETRVIFEADQKGDLVLRGQRRRLVVQHPDPRRRRLRRRRPAAAARARPAPRLVLGTARARRSGGPPDRRVRLNRGGRAGSGPSAARAASCPRGPGRGRRGRRRSPSRAVTGTQTRPGAADDPAPRPVGLDEDGGSGGRHGLHGGSTGALLRASRS